MARADAKVEIVEPTKHLEMHGELEKMGEVLENPDGVGTRVHDASILLFCSFY